MARVVVAGYMLRNPMAGNVFAFFHYVLGLHLLGHDVLYVEESGWPYSCYDPTTRMWDDFPDAGLAIAGRLVGEHCPNVSVCFVNAHADRVFGISRGELRDALARADLLLNIGGVCWLPEFALCRRRALIDMDPLFTQVGEFANKILPDYQTHFTYGLNVGRANCTVPTCGIEWVPTVPPVVPDLWNRESRTLHPLTTVASWNVYQDLHHDHRRYGQKEEELQKILTLPSRTAIPLEIALAGRDEDRNVLRDAGWRVRDAGDVSARTADYVAYITSSLGEFSVAKHAYVASKSGWFSDRSVCYLAAGRPVILQDTGYSDWLPTGDGLLEFSTIEGAADRVERVHSDYERHRLAAAALARSTFGHDVVMPPMMDRALGVAAFS